MSYADFTLLDTPTPYSPNLVRWSFDEVSVKTSFDGNFRVVTHPEIITPSVFVLALDFYLFLW